MLTPESLAKAMDAIYIINNASYDDLSPANLWFVVDGTSAEPEVNWPGELISEHASPEEARIGRARAIIDMAGGVV